MSWLLYFPITIATPQFNTPHTILSAVSSQYVQIPHSLTVQWWWGFNFNCFPRRKSFILKSL